jgi:ribonuclease HII
MVTIKYRQRFNKDSFEAQAWQTNKLVCGIDEVGRGCLAGPVVTAAVILFPGSKSRLVKDSKLLDVDQLQAAYRWIIKHSWYSFGIASHRTIDALNIYYATLKAMKKSVFQLFTHCPEKPSTILVDAMPLDLQNTPYKDIAVYHFPFGESKSSSIAAASIVAKVTRDALMRNMHAVFPQYHLAQHKGYSTQLHQDAVQAHGRTIIHRMRFLENKEFAKQMALAEQQLSFLDNTDFENTGSQVSEISD